MTKNRLAIVVLNWNVADDTIKCLGSLRKQAGIQPDIILVDNASTDDSITTLTHYIKSNPDSPIHFIKNTTNSGFAGGINTGIRYALENQYEYIGTLNPDATADKNWAKSLVGVLESSMSSGIATGILAREDYKTIDSTGDFYTTWGIPSPRNRNDGISKAPQTSENVFGSTGGGFIARASMFRDIGLFDEAFFMYYEDVDLSFRAQLAGYTVVYTPKAVAYHKLSASTNKVPGLATKQTFKNLPLVFIKNVPIELWILILPRFSLTYILILGNAIAHGRGIDALSGWLRSCVLVFGALKERKRIQKNKRVSATYIKSIILHDIPPEQTGMRKFRAFFTGKQ